MAAALVPVGGGGLEGAEGVEGVNPLAGDHGSKTKCPRVRWRGPMDGQAARMEMRRGQSVSGMFGGFEQCLSCLSLPGQGCSLIRALPERREAATRLCCGCAATRARSSRIGSSLVRK